MKKHSIELNQIIEMNHHKVTVTKVSDKSIEVYSSYYKETYTLELYRNNWYEVRMQVRFIKSIEKEMKKKFGSDSWRGVWFEDLGISEEEYYNTNEKRFGYSRWNIIEGVTELRKERTKILDMYISQAPRVEMVRDDGTFYSTAKNK